MRPGPWAGRFYANREHTLKVGALQVGLQSARILRVDTQRREAAEMELQGKRVAILAEDLYEDLELWYPLLRLKETGAEVQVIGTGTKDEYESKHGYPAAADASASQVSAEDFDAVIIPGGYAPDRMRRNEAMVNLVREMFEKGKVVAAICHAGWLPASAGILKGKRMTSFSAIKDDMVNAGAQWEDAEVVVDGNLITSRTPDDLPAFLRAIIEKLSVAG